LCCSQVYSKRHNYYLKVTFRGWARYPAVLILKNKRNESLWISTTFLVSCKVIDQNIAP
jgi:hypothetical protein